MHLNAFCLRYGGMWDNITFKLENTHRQLLQHLFNLHVQASLIYDSSAVDYDLWTSVVSPKQAAAAHQLLGSR